MLGQKIDCQVINFAKNKNLAYKPPKSCFPLPSYTGKTNGINLKFVLLTKIDLLVIDDLTAHENRQL